MHRLCMQIFPTLPTLPWNISSDSTNGSPLSSRSHSDLDVFVHPTSQQSRQVTPEQNIDSSQTTDCPQQSRIAKDGQRMSSTRLPESHTAPSMKQPIDVINHVLLPPLHFPRLRPLKLRRDTSQLLPRRAPIKAHQLSQATLYRRRT